MKEYDISLGNALMIAVWYVPVLLLVGISLLCLMPFIIFYARFNYDGAMRFIGACETWMDRKDEEVEAAIQRLSRKR